MINLFAKAFYRIIITFFHINLSFPGGVLQNLKRMISAHKHDKAMGIDCCVSLDAVSTYNTLPDQAQRILGLCKFSTNDVFVDIGCSTGRVLCIAQSLGVKQAVGIEINPKYAKRAEINTAITSKLYGAHCKILCANAAETTCDDGTYYYLFNPFSRNIIRSALTLIKQTLDRNPRKIKIIYSLPMFCDEIDVLPWLKRAPENMLPKIDNFIVWESAQAGEDTQK